MINTKLRYYAIHLFFVLILLFLHTHSLNHRKNDPSFILYPVNRQINRNISYNNDKDTDLELAINKTTLDKLKDVEKDSIGGLGSSIDISDFPHAVWGRLNEWNPEWTPGKMTMGFFPIIIDDLTNQPNPLQIGFENTIRFRGKHVQSVFNSILDKADIYTIKGEKQVLDSPIFGMCFLNIENGQLAPLAVYGNLVEMKPKEGPKIETIMVKVRVLGRVIIDKVISEEPYIKALVLPIEDKPGISDPSETKRMIDELMTYHDKCNQIEADMLIKLEQHDGADRLRSRTKLNEQLDNTLPAFGIDPSDPEHLQAFAQIASNLAFEFHLIAAERYDALLLQNTESRLLYVLNKLKAKAKQLEIISKSSKEELEKLMDTINELDTNRPKVTDHLEPVDTDEEENEKTE